MRDTPRQPIAYLYGARRSIVYYRAVVFDEYSVHTLVDKIPIGQVREEESEKRKKKREENDPCSNKSFMFTRDARRVR